MEKIVIIINGNGGVGKDTLCDFAAKQFKVHTVSSITPIKEVAQKYGGWNGEKDNKSRKFLAGLKELFVEYNDLPFQYLCKEYSHFMKSKEQILFVHIREGAEIDKFKKQVLGACYTLLVTRKSNENIRWGNMSDDNVKMYKYDLVYENNKSLKESEGDFCDFLITNIQEKLYKKRLFLQIRDNERRDVFENKRLLFFNKYKKNGVIGVVGKLLWMQK